MAAYVAVIVVPGAVVGHALSDQVNAVGPALRPPLAGAAPVTRSQPGDVPAMPTPTPAGATRGGGPALSSPAPRESLLGWAAGLSPLVGIPTVALAAYGQAQLAIGDADPDCRLSWPTLAGIGWVESDHGRYAGAVLGPDGRSTPPIVGVVLAGQPGLAVLPDTDRGALDGDPVFDRAVGPLQFVPATWAAWAGDGDGDGVADVFDLDDAALAAGRYLCATGGDLTRAEGWTAAVLAYNRSGLYVESVRSAANEYAARSRSG